MYSQTIWQSSENASTPTGTKKKLNGCSRLPVIIMQKAMHNRVDKAAYKGQGTSTDSSDTECNA